jgi:hypothetical protein
VNAGIALDKGQYASSQFRHICHCRSIQAHRTANHDISNVIGFSILGTQSCLKENLDQRLFVLGVNAAYLEICTIGQFNLAIPEPGGPICHALDLCMINTTEGQFDPANTAILRLDNAE